MIKDATKSKRWDPVAGDILPVEGDSNQVKVVDLVNHPPHYNAGRIEVFDALQDWSEAGMIGYAVSNVIKYCARYRLKGKPLEDLKKARWYLDKEIEFLEGKQSDSQ